MNTNIPFYAGESKPVDFDLTADLRPGQTIASIVTFETESPVVFVSGSGSISPDGRVAQGRFSVPSGTVAGGRYTITLVATLQNPTAEEYRLPGVIQVMRVPQ